MRDGYMCREINTLRSASQEEGLTPIQWPPEVTEHVR